MSLPITDSDGVIRFEVLLRHYCSGSKWYSGNLEHLIALPNCPVETLGEAGERLKHLGGKPYFVFSPVPFAVPQTYAMSPGLVSGRSFRDLWTPWWMRYHCDRGYWFDEEPFKEDVLKKLIGKLGWSDTDELELTRDPPITRMELAILKEMVGLD